MILTTERLTLVPLGTEHFETTHAYSSDIENTRFMMFLPNESREETLSFLRQCEEQWHSPDPDFFEFAIIHDKIHIGAVGIYRLKEAGEWELGWILDKRYHGKGYATEAAKAVIKCWRKQNDTSKFIAHCDSENISSARVMEKLGMTLVCVSGGRKNRSSDEERKELLYELNI